MPLLYYWRADNYWRDLDLGVGYHLNQANPLMHEIDLGDSLWAFTRAKNGRYVLAAELIVRAKTLNPPNFRYGKYRVWGDLFSSRYFQAENQPGVEQIIRHLSFRAEATNLGQSFQGFAAVRKLTLADHALLAASAKYLPLEPRACILPEEMLEAMLLLGEEEAVVNLVQEEKAGISERRAQYLYHEAPSRNRELVSELHRIYDGKCQICLWNPVDIYGHYICHGHHLQWLSRGGEDDLSNMTLICPNHHAAIHRCDAPLDYSDMAFDFGSHREALQMNYHLVY
jgi:5-methylcytosine-specific restriction protein A